MSGQGAARNFEIASSLKDEKTLRMAYGTYTLLSLQQDMVCGSNFVVFLWDLGLVSPRHVVPGGWLQLLTGAEGHTEVRCTKIPSPNTKHPEPLIMNTEPTYWGHVCYLEGSGVFSSRAKGFFHLGSYFGAILILG